MGSSRNCRWSFAHSPPAVRPGSQQATDRYPPVARGSGAPALGNSYLVSTSLFYPLWQHFDKFTQAVWVHSLHQGHLVLIQWNAFHIFAVGIKGRKTSLASRKTGLKTTSVPHSHDPWFHTVFVGICVFMMAFLFLSQFFLLFFTIQLDLLSCLK